MLKKILRLFALFALTLTPALAQQTAIVGDVTDSSGAAIPGAKVTATRVGGGSTYNTVTNATGEFQIPSVTAADYTVHADSNGFAPVEQRITLLFGQTASLTLKLQLASTTTSVEVLSAQSAVIDTVSSQVAGNIDTKETEGLPLNGRNWEQLAELVPGVTVNSITVVPLGTDNYGGYQINLDGQQVTQDAGSSASGDPLISKEAIDQFQLITNRFDATLGRSDQVEINAATKSGTDLLHGSAFGYFRNSGAGSAADPIAHQVLPFADQQFGGTLGGPIFKGRMFYFGSYEGERNPTTLVSNPYGFASVYPGGVYTHPDTVKDEEYLVRIDQQMHNGDHLFLRGNADTTTNPYTGISGTTVPSQLYAADRNNYEALLKYTHSQGPNFVNSASFGWYHYGFTYEPYYPEMAIVFPSVSIGSPSSYPERWDQENQSYHDDIFWLHKKHSFKIGGEYINELIHGEFDKYEYGVASMSTNLTTGTAAGSFSAVFPNLFDPTTWNYSVLNPLVTTYTQAFGNEHMHIPRKTLAFWIQDDWKLHSRLTINLGLRYDNDLGIFNMHVKLASGIPTADKDDNHDFGPRVGFAWDPFGKGKTVIRGGSGVFFALISSNMIVDASVFNGQTSVQPSVAKTAKVTVNLQDPFGTTTPAQIIANPLNYLQSGQIMAPDVATPWALQSSIGIQQALPLHMALTADYVHDKVNHDWTINDTNLYYNPNNGYPENPSTFIGPNGYGRPNTLYTAIPTFQTPANVGSILDALQVGLRLLGTQGLTGGLAYTLARQKDNSPTPFSYPNNPFDFKDEWSTTASDQKHTLQVSGIYNWRYGLHGGIMYHYGSGAHFAVTAGGSPLGLGSYVSNRAFCGVTATSSFCPTARTVTYNNPIYNQLDPVSGFDITTRNQFVGKDVQKVDLNLAKDFKFHEKYKVTFQVEAFNVLNHSNYGSYNTSITTSAYGTPASVSGNLDYYARMFQFSSRFAF
jgi:hypothetical protein